MNKLPKRLLSFAVALVMVLSMVPFGGLDAFAAEEETSYDLAISSADALKAFADEVNQGNSYEGKTVVLANDIDMSYSAVVIGTKANPFKGTFDGQNHTVSNLTVYEDGSESDYFADSDDCIGLFGCINTPAVIKNVTVHDPYLVGSSYVGGIVGMAYTGRIENCHVTGEIDIEGFYMVGGITGHGYAKISDCSVIGEAGWDYSYVGASYKESDLEGDNVGGIVGHNAENNDITNCTVENITVSGTRKVGGIVGITAQSTRISGCSVTDVTVETTATAEYAASKVTTMSIGGIVGQYMADSEGTGGVLRDCAVSGLTFANENGVSVNAGALTGGVRASSGATTAPAEGNLSVSGNAAAAVSGSNVEYLEPEVSAEAEVGGVEYPTLEAAIAAATEGQTVTLLKDLTVESDLNNAGKGLYNIADGQKVTIDLNGKTIHATDNSTGNFILFYNYGELTIKNGSINMSATNDRDWNAESAIVLNRGGILNVEGGTYTHNGGTDMAFVLDNSGNWYGDATTNVYDGTTLSSSYIAIRNRMEQNSHGASGSADLNIYGGTISGTSRAVWAQAASVSETAPATGKINVSGGTVGLIDTPRATGAVSMTTITGGTVEAFKGEAGELTVTGGTITGDVNIMTANGEPAEYVVTNEGVYTLAAAKVGDTVYQTLAEAVEAAANGGTVTVLTDVTLTETLVVDHKTISLDLNGHALTNEIPETDSTFHTIMNKGDLTVIDSVGGGKMQSNSAKGYVIYTEGGSLTVDGAKIVGINQGYALVTWTAGDSITIEEGSVVEGRGAVYVDGGATGTIDGGTFTMTVQTTNNQDNVVYVGGTSELTINGGIFSTGEITGAQRLAIAVLGIAKVTINDGTFYGLTGDIQSRTSAGNVVVKGGTFTGTKMDERTADSIAITGGTYTYDVSDYCTENFSCVKDAEGKYTVAKPPKAEVSVMGGMTLTQAEHHYMVWPSGDATIDRPLEILMNFKALETKEEAAAGGFGDWKTDFYVTVDGLETDTIIADGCYLAGNYGEFGWIVIPMDGVEVVNGVANPIVSMYDPTLNYKDICGSVKDFTAAIHVDPAILAANPNMTVKLELKMTNPVDETDTLVVGEPAVYDAQTLANGIAAQNMETGVCYSTLQAALDEAQAGETVKLLADAVVSSKLILEDSITIDGNGYSIVADENVTWYTIKGTVVQRKNYAPWVVLKADGIVLKSIAIDANGCAGGVKVENAENVVFDNVSILGAQADALTVVGSVNFKNYLKLDTNSSVIDAKSGVVTAEDGTVFDMTKWMASVSPATNDLKGAVDTEGNPFFCAYDSTTYYMSRDGVATTVKDLTLLDDLELNSSISLSGTVDLNGHDLNVAEGKTVKISSDTTITGAGDLAADLVLTSAAATLTAPEGLNVTTTVADSRVVYENGVYSVEAITYVAQIGEVKYESVAEALEAAKNGGTVTVLTDITLTEGITVPADAEIILDLNGKTVSYTGDVAGEAMLTNRGDLTITDSTEEQNGRIVYTYTGAPDTAYSKGNYTVSNGGSLTLNAGTVENATAKMSHACYAVDNNSSAGAAELTVNGGKILNTNNYAVRQFASGSQTNTVTVNGGEVVGTRAVWMQAAGSKAENAPQISLTVTGGKLEGTGESAEYKLAVYSYSYGDSMQNMAITVSGGEIAGDIATTGGKNKEAVESVTITGGTLTDVYSYGADEKAVEAITITGGTFAINDAEMYALDDGYVFEQNEQGTYSVEEGNFEAYYAQGNLYGTATDMLAEAYANGGGTVKLMENVSTDDLVIVRKGVTLDLNGMTLEITGYGELMTSSTGAKVIDSTVGEGLLKCSRDMLSLSANDKYVPVWVEADAGYRFDLISTYRVATKVSDTQYKLQFWLNDLTPDCLLADMLADGGSDNGITVSAKMTWKNAKGEERETYFTYTDEHVKEWSTNPAGRVFNLYVTGMDGCTDVKFSVAVSSTTADGEVVLEYVTNASTPK